MKTILIYTVLAALILGLSCKPKPANEPVPDLSKCRILKETYKTLDGKQGEAETVRVENKAYNVQTDRVTTFAYDEQGRLKTESYVYSMGSPGTISYSYEPEQIVRTYSETNGVSLRKDTILLNEQGFISRQGNLKFRYDAQGFKVQSFIDSQVLWTYEIKSGNVTKIIYTIEDGSINQMTYDYTHNTTKPNLPNRYLFLGRSNSNLLSRELFTIDKTTSYYKPGPAYETKYYYVFDGQGRVKRRIAIGKNLNPTWDLEADPYGVGVIDYEYACD